MHMCPNCGIALSRYEQFEWGNVTLAVTREILYEGRPVALTPNQRLIAEALIRGGGRVLSRATLMDIIDCDGDPMNISAIVLRIRRAFQAINPAFDQLRNNRALGYQWVFVSSDDRLAA